MKGKSESEVAQSCPTLCNPMDCSPPGSSIHGIFQARVLEWGAIAFSGITAYLLLKWPQASFCQHGIHLISLWIRICKELTPGVGDGQGGLGCCDSWGCKESDTTEQLNWTEWTYCFMSLRIKIFFYFHSIFFWYEKIHSRKGVTGDIVEQNENPKWTLRAYSHNDW